MSIKPFFGFHNDQWYRRDSVSEAAVLGGRGFNSTPRRQQGPPLINGLPWNINCFNRIRVNNIIK